MIIMPDENTKDMKGTYAKISKLSCSQGYPEKWRYVKETQICKLKIDVKNSYKFPIISIEKHIDQKYCYKIIVDYIDICIYRRRMIIGYLRKRLE